MEARSEFEVGVINDISYSCDGCIFLFDEPNTRCRNSGTDIEKTTFTDCVTQNFDKKIKYVLVHKLTKTPLTEEEIINLVKENHNERV